MTRWFAPLLGLAIAAPVGAQQWQVAREQYAFAGRQLTVHVEAETEGTLRIIRGAPGAVRVSGQSGAGLTAAGLTADEHLTLTAAGEGPVTYVVVVPERVWIDVRLPDRVGIESMGGHERNRTFQWEAAVEEQVARVPVWTPEPETRLGVAGAYTALARPGAPHTVSLPDLSNLRSVTVRVEGSTFRVSASRPLVLAQGDPRFLEIRPAGPALEIAVVVPAGTGEFTLSAGGERALTVRAGEVAVLCAPHTRQWLSGDRGWVTFTPVEGTLECTDRPPGGMEIERRTSITATGPGR
jgi:hypothetical protein